MMKIITINQSYVIPSHALEQMHIVVHAMVLLLIDLRIKVNFLILLRYYIQYDTSSLHYIVKAILQKHSDRIAEVSLKNLI